MIARNVNSFDFRSTPVWPWAVPIPEIIVCLHMCTHFALTIVNQGLSLVHLNLLTILAFNHHSFLDPILTRMITDGHVRLPVRTCSLIAAHKCWIRQTHIHAHSRVCSRLISINPMVVDPCMHICTGASTLIPRPTEIVSWLSQWIKFVNPAHRSQSHDIT